MNIVVGEARPPRHSHPSSGPGLRLLVRGRVPDGPAGGDVGVGDGHHRPLLAGARLEAAHRGRPSVLAKVQVQSVLALQKTRIYYKYHVPIKTSNRLLKL